jgi:drug/metabolite transporter (DMT)-like permease
MTTKQIESESLAGLSKARTLLIIASILWSTSGFFTRWLQTTFENGAGPEIHSLQMAFFRVLFASLGISLFVRLKDVKFAKGMVFTSISFAIMTCL